MYLTRLFILVLDSRYMDKWYTAVGWKSELINACKSDVQKLCICNYKPKQADTSHTTAENDEMAVKRSRNEILDRNEQLMKIIQSSGPEDALERFLGDPVVTQDFLDDAKTR